MHKYQDNSFEKEFIERHFQFMMENAASLNYLSDYCVYWMVYKEIGAQYSIYLDKDSKPHLTNFKEGRSNNIKYNKPIKLKNSKIVSDDRFILADGNLYVGNLSTDSKFKVVITIDLQEDGSSGSITFVGPKDESLAKYVFDIFVNEFIDVDNFKNTDYRNISLLTVANRTLYTKERKIEIKDIDITRQYNDDIPIDKIRSEIEDTSKPSFIILNGEPGTGKTTLIKKLIRDYYDKSFVYVDLNMLAKCDESEIIDFLADNSTERILIMEDCEKFLKSRDDYGYTIMPTILNLTDGILGQVLKPKIICTFNTNLKNIDQALLRKGRLSVKYEFKKLNKEKASKLIGKESLNEDMTLAELFNIEEKVDFSNTQKKKIGFG